MTLTLLEFVACCFEKNELIAGAVDRWCGYETVEAAERQVESLVAEATALFMTKARYRIMGDRVESWFWPTFHILHRGLAIHVYVGVRPEAFVGWISIPTAVWRGSDDDMSAIYAAVESERGE